MNRQSIFRELIIVLLICAPALLMAQTPGGKRLYGPSPNTFPYFTKFGDIPLEKELFLPLEEILSKDSKEQKCIHFGMYASDLSLQILYGDKKQVGNYLNVLKKATFNMSLRNIFRKEIWDIFVNHPNNTDSLIYMFSESVLTCNQALILSKRYEEAALLVTGTWIESLYLLSQLAISSNNQKIKDRVGEQKLSLDQLIQLTQQYPDSKSLSKIEKKLQQLEEIYQNIKIEVTYLPPKVDSKTGSTEVQSKHEVVISDNTLAEIHAQVILLRKKLF